MSSVNDDYNSPIESFKSSSDSSSATRRSPFGDDTNRRATLDKLTGRHHGGASTSPRTTSPKDVASSGNVMEGGRLKNITLLSSETFLHRSSSPRVLPSSTDLTSRPSPPQRHSIELPTLGFVRSQSLGVTRRLSANAALVEQGEFAPMLSGNYRLGLGSASENEGDEEGKEVTTGERKNRSSGHDSKATELGGSAGAPSSEWMTGKGQSDPWKDLEDLPPSPKLWLPSHLALFLSSHLSLHPRLASDITHFIRTSRLSGRIFLRLRDADLEEMGINLRWRAALQTARETLRREALGGRIFWGYEGGQSVSFTDSTFDEIEDQDHARLLLSLSTASSSSSGRTRRVAGSSSASSSTSTSDSRPPSVGNGMPYVHQARRRGSIEVEGRDDDDELIKEEWKQSWKRLVHLGGRGKVRGMASAFDKVDEASRENSPVKSRQEEDKRLSRIWVRGGHERTGSAESDRSDASIDSSSSSNGRRERSEPSRGEPTARPRPHTQSATTSAIDVFRTDTTSSYQSQIMTQPQPYELVRRTSINRHSVTGVPGRSIIETSTIRGPDPSLTRAGSGGQSRSKMSREDKRKSLATIFDLEIPRVGCSTLVDKAASKVDELVEWEIGATKGKRGSMVLVKHSQLEALSRRMDEVEEALAASVQAGSEAPLNTISGSTQAASSPIGSNNSASSRSQPTDASTAALEALNHRLDQIEGRLVPTSPPAPPLSPSYHPRYDLCHPHSPTATVDAAMSSWIAHQLTLSEIEASRLARRRELEDLQAAERRSLFSGGTNDSTAGGGRTLWHGGHQGPLSWSSLGGYVVAASIGIGIVAGEVVAAKMLNVRAGRR